MMHMGERFCTGGKRARKFKRSDPKIYVPDWCPTRKKPCELRVYKRDGEKETDFIDVVSWRSTAEFVSRYFAKGRMAVVEGRLQIRDWTDKEGGKRRSAEVIADNVYFGDSKPKEDGAPSADADFGAPPSGFTPDFGDDGNMPF